MDHQADLATMAQKARQDMALQETQVVKEKKALLVPMALLVTMVIPAHQAHLVQHQTAVAVTLIRHTKADTVANDEGDRRFLYGVSRLIIIAEISNGTTWHMYSLLLLRFLKSA